MTENLAKVSVTVDPAVVEWIDKQIAKRTYRNRSHAFDVAGHLLMDMAESEPEKGAQSPKEAAVEVAA